MKKILVVDDDPSVLALVSEIISNMGHLPLLARNSLEALGLFDIHSPVDAVVTDIRMEGMDGIELGKRLVGRQPGLRVLFISGFISDASAFLVDSVLPLDAYFLHKPFSPLELSRVISIMLVAPKLSGKAAG